MYTTSAIYVQQNISKANKQANKSEPKPKQVDTTFVSSSCFWKDYDIGTLSVL